MSMRKTRGTGRCLAGWGAQREEVLLPGPRLDEKLTEGKRDGVRLEKESAVRRKQSGKKGRERILGEKKHKIKIQKEGLDC